MSNDPDTPDLDLIAAEIKATTEDQPKEEEEEPKGDTTIVKRSADDIADRRAKAWALRQRGKTYRQIGEELEVSIGTVKRDLDISKAQHREAVSTYDREDHIATNLTQYDDLIREAWSVHTGADKETKLKALTLIKQTMQAKEKSLQANGVVRKEAQVQETVQISLVSRFDDASVGNMAAALLGSQMNLSLSPPTPDVIDDAELVEDEEEVTAEDFGHSGSDAEDEDNDL